MEALDEPARLEAVRLAAAMFAGHTGMSRDEIIDFFARLGVDAAGDAPDEHPRRKNALLHCLARLEEDGRTAALRALLDHRGPMRHGRPKDADRAALTRLLDSI